MTREFPRVNWQEVRALAALVAEAWKRTGQNPTEMECVAMVATARAMAAHGLTVLH